MKQIYVDVSELRVHSEKIKVRKEFETRGWTVREGVVSVNAPVPKMTVTHYIFTCWFNDAPVLPKVPEECRVSVI